MLKYAEGDKKILLFIFSIGRKNRANAIFREMETQIKTHAYHIFSASN